VDTSKAVTHVSLCAGYGGIDLGLKRAIPSLRTVAFSEIEAFACANLVSKMESGQLDPAPIWTDLKTFPWGYFRGVVDILSGGYPCQPFSTSGRRRGERDPRHLWPYIADGIAAMRPQLCFFENVEGHITLGLSNVIEDLATMGYRTTWGIFSAAEVGAPHSRKRVFILAVSSGFRGAAGFSGQDSREKGQSGKPNNSGGQILGNTFSPGVEGPYNHQSASTGIQLHALKSGSWPSGHGQQQHFWEPPRVVGDTEWKRLERQWDHTATEHRQDSWFQSWSANGDDANTGKAQPPLGGDPNGASGGLDYAQLCVSYDNRTDELRLLGNGVVPATAHKAFVTLLQELK
jgi:site-specific DNA-cytosine methylase